jgi:predicted kinase
LGRYTPQVTAAVYAELLKRAEDLLRYGESVVLDASWIEASWRNAAKIVTSRTGSDLAELCCLVRPDIAEIRIVQRLSEGLDVSEATPEVRRAMGVAMERWLSSFEIDTTGITVEESTVRALEILGEGRPSDNLTTTLRRERRGFSQAPSCAAW